MSSRALTAVVLTAAIALPVGFFLARATAPAAPSGAGNAPAPTAAHARGNPAATTYRCPMHPWIHSDHPGRCTLCGMELTPATGDSPDAADSTGSAPTVHLSPASAAVTGIATTPVTRGPLTRTLRVNGILDDDDTRHRILAARVPGRIEKLFVNEVGASVAADAPLVTLYSPEIATAQRLYLERLRSGSDAISASALADAREKLLLLGLLPADITRLEQSGSPDALVTLRAPFAGTIIARHAYPGDYVTENSPIFEIGDFSQLWFIFDAYEPDLAWLDVGLPVDLETPSAPGAVISGHIAFIDPNIDPTTRTAHVRVIVPNPHGSLRHRQTATARVTREFPARLLVPRSAVLHTRARPVVYVDRGAGAYELREVTLGPAGDTAVAVTAGLAEGESVVTQSALLLDSQAQLTAPPPAASAAPAVSAAELRQLALALADAAAALGADDLPAYAKQLPALAAAVPPAGPAHDRLAPLAASLTATPDLAAARATFEPFSTAATDLVRSTGLLATASLHAFECPMSPELGHGRWIQRAAKTQNPFYGSAMPDCGNELE